MKNLFSGKIKSRSKRSRLAYRLRKGPGKNIEIKNLEYTEAHQSWKLKNEKNSTHVKADNPTVEYS